MRPEFQYLLLCRLIYVGIEVEFIGSYCPHAALCVEVAFERFFRKHFHSTASVPDDHDLLHIQNVNRKHERPHNIYRCCRSDVPNYIRIGGFDVQPFEQLV